MRGGCDYWSGLFSPICGLEEVTVCFLCSASADSTMSFFFWLCRVPCRIGMCTTPMQVTSSQLFASELFPQFVIKALLYPGAVANAFVMSKTIPSYDDLLDTYNFANSKAVSSAIDLRRIEVFTVSLRMAFFIY